MQLYYALVAYTDKYFIFNILYSLYCIHYTYNSFPSISRYDIIKDLIVTGSGSFQVSMHLLDGAVPLPYNYSLSREQPVVVEVRLNTSSDHIKVVISKCWCTPTPNPKDAYSRVFLEKRSVSQLQLYLAHSYCYHYDYC